MSAYTPVRITILKDQNDWLEKHPEINLSGLVQRAIDDEILTRDPEFYARYRTKVLREKS